MNTSMMPDVFAAVEEAIELHRTDTVRLLQELIRIPSINHPPTGDEKEVQEFYSRHLMELGFDTELFEADGVPSFQKHPGRLKDHDMAGRPCVVGTLRGSGGGHSLMLLAHADVEVTGDESLWTGGDPFSGALCDGKIFGRGAGDDKCGMAINAMVPLILKSAGIKLKGDLIVTSVPDEEQGGSNGAVLLLARGYKADAALCLDGMRQRIGISSLGGSYCVVDLRVPALQMDTVRLLKFFDRIRQSIVKFKKMRADEFAAHPHYNADIYKQVAIRLSEIRLGVDDVAHGTFKMWFFLLPGEEPGTLQKRVEEILQSIVDVGEECRLEWESRYIPPFEVNETNPFVTTIKKAFRRATHRVPEVKGFWMNDGCFVNKYGGFPCLLFGPACEFGQKGMPHQPDEYVDVEAVIECTKTVVFCAMEWCGYERTGRP